MTQIIWVDIHISTCYAHFLEHILECINHRVQFSVMCSATFTTKCQKLNGTPQNQLWLKISLENPCLFHDTPNIPHVEMFWTSFLTTTDSVRLLKRSIILKRLLCFSFWWSSLITTPHLLKSLWQSRWQKSYQTIKITIDDPRPRVITALQIINL